MLRKRLVPVVIGGLIGANVVVASVGMAGPAAAVTADARVTVKIEAVRALDSLDSTTQADFYPQVYIGGQSFGGASLEITNQNEVAPDDWSFTATVPFTFADATTTVNIELYDADGGLNGARDHVDITDNDSDRNLDDIVGLLNCAQKVPGIGVGGDSGGGCDQGLVTNGNASDKASMKFRVTVEIPDSDGDGLYDTWEANGYDANGDGTVDVNLPQMGAKVDHKDLFLELDATSNFRVTRADIDAVKRAFAAAPVDAGTSGHELSGGIDAKPNPDGRRGITLHVDTGTILDGYASEGTALGTCNNGADDGGDGVADAADPDCIQFGAFLDASSEDGAYATCSDGNDNDADGMLDAADTDCLLSENLGGGSVVTVQKFDNEAACNLDPSFYATKAMAFNPLRARIFRWGLLLPLDGSCAASGGWGELGGNDFMVFNTDGGSVMHEFGHNLRLDHGGFESQNCKPNYVSVMNYSHQSGISRTGGGAILDFEPPRLNLDGSTRGSVPGRIDEAALDENTVLDAGDSLNHFIHIDATGGIQSPALSSHPDYNADTADPPYDSGFGGNVDNPGPNDCKNTASDSKLDSQNDWLRISLPFAQFGDSADGPINPETHPHLTTAELLALDNDIHATDLNVTMTGPTSAVAGASATYTVKVANQGQNPATPVVTTTIPTGTTATSPPAGCVTSTASHLLCVLPELAPGQEAPLTVTLAVAADLVYNAGAPVNKTVDATVVAVRGSDPDQSNNSASFTTRMVAQADLSVTAAAVSPPTELIIGQAKTVSVSSTTSNSGPSTPMDVRVTTAVVASSGSSASPATQNSLLPAVTSGTTRTVTTTFSLSCSQPGQHTFNITTSVAPDRVDDSDPIASNNSATQQLSLDCVVPVALNIKPGQTPNSVNRTISSDVPVAILTTAAGEYGLPLSFDATKILATTVRFAPIDVANAGRGARETHTALHLERSYELNETTRDLDLDGVMHFDPTKAELLLNTTRACTKGKFTGPGGQVWTFLGCDSIRIVR